MGLRVRTVVYKLLNGLWRRVLSGVRVWGEGLGLDGQLGLLLGIRVLIMHSGVGFCVGFEIWGEG